MSEVWAEIGPAIAFRSEADEAVVSAHVEKRVALAARADLGARPVPVEVNLVEWMKSGFFSCQACHKHWQPEQVAPAGQLMECPFCGASKWKVKWTAPAF